MGVQNTDELALKSLIEATVNGITPTVLTEQAKKWRKRARRSTPSQATRTFHVELSEYESPVESMAGATTASMVNEVTVSIVTDYSLPHQDVMPIVLSDHRQLLRAIAQLKNTDANGIWWVQSLGASDLPDDETADHWQVDHDFLVRYQTAGTF